MAPAGIVVSIFENQQGVTMALLQSKGSYLVTDLQSLKMECAHAEGFSLTKVEPDLYGYACNCGCGFVLNFDPAKYHPDCLAYIKHEPSDEDKVMRLSEGGKY